MTYSLKSSLWEGEILLTYDMHGFIQSFSMERAQMTELQQQSFLRFLPRTTGDLDNMLLKYDHLNCSTVALEVSFEMFWNKYDEKIRSSKKRSEKIWARLSKSDQLKAYNFISKYNNSISPGVARKYAETYLNAELWNN